MPQAPISAELTAHPLNLKKPLHTAAGSIHKRQAQVVVIDDGNFRGLGEATPLPVFGGEDPLSCQKALQAALPLIPDLCQRWLDRDALGNNLGPLEAILRETPCARSAVEGALYDWWAQRTNQPVAALYAYQDGSLMAETLPVNALLAGTAEDWGEIASTVVAKGWKTIKLKAPADVDAAVSMVEQVREWVGSNVALRLDVNGAWTEEQTRRFLAQGTALQLEYLEQPLAADELAAIGRLQTLAPIPIALDESIRSAADVAQVARYQAGQVVILKPMLLGGWRETLRASTLARQMGMDVVMSTFIDGSIGRAHATHMAAALGCVDRAQGLATGPLLSNDLTSEPLAPRAGAVSLQDRPGLGIGELLPVT